jgi:hypothetical protein
MGLGHGSAVFRGGVVVGGAQASVGGGGGRMGLQVFVEKLGHGSAGFRGGFVGWLVVRVPWRTC